MRNALPNFSVPQVPELEDSTAQDFLQKHVDQVGQHVTRVQQTLAKMPDMRSIGHVCEFRLTGLTGTPVPTADVSNIVSIFCAPYKGNRIALYDGKTWPVYESVEFSIAVPATTSTMYDVFCYANSGIPALELLAWTNDTTRATALTTQNGILVKTGDKSRRYMGSFRTTTVSGQTEDSLAKRYIWSYYNRVRRPMRVYISSTGYTYTTATLRQAAGSTANQLDLVMGWSEDLVEARVTGSASNTSAGVAVQVTVGLDSTTTRATDAFYADGNVIQVASQAQGAFGAYKGLPGVGRHTLTWLELSAATGTTTWNGNATYNISGELWG